MFELNLFCDFVVLRRVGFADVDVHAYSSVCFKRLCNFAFLGECVLPRGQEEQALHIPEIVQQLMRSCHGNAPVVSGF